MKNENDLRPANRLKYLPDAAIIFKRALLLAAAYLVSTIAFPIIASADDALVLPHRRFRITVRPTVIFFDERFTQEGGREPIGIDFDNRIVDRGVIPVIGQLESGFGLGPGSLNAGRTSFDSSVTSEVFPLALEYGLTKKLTLGLIVPVIHHRVGVDFSISGGNVGLNPVRGQAAFGPLSALPAVPVFFSGRDVGVLLGRAPLGVIFPQVRPVNTADAQLALRDPAFGIVSKPLKTFDGTDIGDIEIGAKYLFYRSKIARMAFTAGVRLPTGQVDDPDNFVDLGFGDGQTDIELRYHLDYFPSKRVWLNFTSRYIIQLPDEQVKRIPNAVNAPLAPLANKLKVDRDLGDSIDLELSSKILLDKLWTIELQFNSFFKGEDEIEGDRPLPFSSLTDVSGVEFQRAGAGLKFSTIPMVIEKKFRYPIDVKLFYFNTFAGSGGRVPASQIVSLEFKIVF